jgi:hypothetical protein
LFQNTIKAILPLPFLKGQGKNQSPFSFLHPGKKNGGQVEHVHLIMKVVDGVIIFGYSQGCMIKAEVLTRIAFDRALHVSGDETPKTILLPPGG